MLFQTNFLQNTVKYTLDNISTVFLKIVLAILIFLFGFIFGKIVGRTVYKLLSEFELNKVVKKTTGIKLNLEHLLSNILSYSIYFLALVAALEQVGIANFVLYLVSAAVIIMILTSFFLAIRDFLPDVLAGIYLYRKEELRKSSKIVMKQHDGKKIKGEIIDMDLLQIKIKTEKEETLNIPNSIVAKSELKIEK